MKPIHDRLRETKTLAGPFPSFCTDQVPKNPHELFLDWLEAAFENGIKEPHAMTLSTVDEYGYPDARTLILKDVDSNGWYFASSSKSKKGQQIQANQHVSLTFYWQPIERQVRIRGKAIECEKKLCERDFLERGKIARAIALIGKQSTIIKNHDDLESELAKQLNRLEQEPNLFDPSWTLYRVEASEVEFWQGDIARKHIRVKYIVTEEGWKKEALWP